MRERVTAAEQHPIGHSFRRRVHVEVSGRATSHPIPQDIVGHGRDFRSILVDDDQTEAGELEDPLEGGEIRAATALDIGDVRLRDAHSRSQVALAEVGEAPCAADQTAGILHFHVEIVPSASDIASWSPHAREPLLRGIHPLIS